MPAPVNCCNQCEDTEFVQIPGVEGDAGADGTDGDDGINAYTTTTANFTIPAIAAAVNVAVVESGWMAVGQTVFASDGTDHGTFEVTTITSQTLVVLTFLGANGDSAAGVTVNSGATVTPAGRLGNLAAALPTALTDNSTGTASNTIAAGAGVFTLSIPITLVQMTGAGDVLTQYTPGYAFKILKVDAHVVEAVTTAGDGASLNLEIGTTNVTGGVVALTSANCTPLGVQIAGTAVTANNTGSATDHFSVEVAAGAGWFAEGAIVLLIKIQNMDTANAVASLADHINDLITCLT